MRFVRWKSEIAVLRRLRFDFGARVASLVAFSSR